MNLNQENTIKRIIYKSCIQIHPMEEVTISQIKEVNRKASVNYPWSAKYIFAPLSVYFTKPFINVHPNIMTFIMIIIGISSLPFFFLGGYWNILIGVFLLYTYVIFDGVDGNIARVMDKKSMRGKYLDFIPTIIVNPLVFVTLGFGSFHLTGNLNYILLGFSAGFFYLAKEPARLFRYLMIQELGLKEKSAYMTNKKSTLVKLNEYSSIIFDYHGVMNIILFFAIFNMSKYLVIFYGLTMPFIFISRAVYEFYFWKRKDLNKK